MSDLMRLGKRMDIMPLEPENIQSWYNYSEFIVNEDEPTSLINQDDFIESSKVDQLSYPRLFRPLLCM